MQVHEFLIAIWLYFKAPHFQNWCTIPFKIIQKKNQFEEILDEVLNQHRQQFRKIAIFFLLLAECEIKK